MSIPPTLSVFIDLQTLNLARAANRCPVLAALRQRGIFARRMGKGPAMRLSVGGKVYDPAPLSLAWLGAYDRGQPVSSAHLVFGEV